MGLYTKSAQQTVLDMIVTENPKLAGITSAQVAWGTPLAGSGVATTVKMRGKPFSGWTGVAQFTYNRVNIGTLFANQSGIVITQYNATKLSDLLPRFNSVYGLNIQASDLVSDPVLSGTSATVTMTLTNSVMYLGSVSVAWTKGSYPQIWELYPNRVLTNLTVPVLMLKAFQVDFTANTSTITAHDVGVAFTSGSSTAVAIAAMISQATGLTVTLGATTTPGTGAYDLSGFTMALKTIDQLSDANPNYRKVAVLTPPSNFGKQNVTIYLHYDKIV